jgi:hypothetical protein
MPIVGFQVTLTPIKPGLPLFGIADADRNSKGCKKGSYLHLVLFGNDDLEMNLQASIAR